MEGEGVVRAKEDDKKDIFPDGVTFLNNIIVFDWPAMFSGWRRTGENFAAQRISRRRTVGWIVKKYRSCHYYM
jgi:hypothetical protein